MGNNRNTVLKNSKSGAIAFFEDQNELTNWEIYHAHWETHLSSSDYWKNWREKINGFQNVKGVNFYADRLLEFIEFVKDHTRKDIRFVENAKPWDPEKTPKLIEQELKRLENISEEEFRKTDKWSNSVIFREMSVKEIFEMLDYEPPNETNITQGSKNLNNDLKIPETNTNKPQKDNKAKTIFAISALATLAFAGIVLVKKNFRKKVKK